MSNPSQMASEDFAYMQYLTEAESAYQDCIEDYRRGRGVASFYRYRGRLIQAHKRFMQDVQERRS